MARSTTSAAFTPAFFDMRSRVSSRVSWVVSCSGISLALCDLMEGSGERQQSLGYARLLGQSF